MKNKGFLFGGIPCLVLIAGASVWFWHDSARKLESQTQLLAQMRSETAEMRKQNKKVSEEVQRRRSASARNEPASSQNASPAVQKQENPFMKKTEALVGQAALVYERMKQAHGAMIPELALLSASDWLKLGDAGFDLSTPQGEQEAFAHLRQVARQRLFGQFGMGIAKWQAANPQAIFVDVQQLKPYLEEPVTLGMLSRYEIVPPHRWKEFTSEDESSAPQLVIAERTQPQGALEKRAWFIKRVDFTESYSASNPRRSAE